MTTSATILHDIPLASGRGRNVVAVDESGIFHLFRIHSEEHLDEARFPVADFTLETARELARRVLSGEERTVTASWTLKTLAAAVLATGGEHV